VDKEERWNASLGVNYTVDNFGIIDDSDSGNDVACCILPKHAQMPSKPVTQEEHQDTGESNQVGDLVPRATSKSFTEELKQISKLKTLATYRVSLQTLANQSVSNSTPLTFVCLTFV
jgi:hypothetical protein